MNSSELPISISLVLGLKIYTQQCLALYACSGNRTQVLTLSRQTLCWPMSYVHYHPMSINWILMEKRNTWKDWQDGGGIRLWVYFCFSALQIKGMRALLYICFIIYNENGSVLGSEGDCRISIQGPETCIWNLWCSASLACHQHWPALPQPLLSFCILATEARQQLYHLFLAS